MPDNLNPESLLEEMRRRRRVPPAPGSANLFDTDAMLREMKARRGQRVVEPPPVTDTRMADSAEASAAPPSHPLSGTLEGRSRMSPARGPNPTPTSYGHALRALHERGIDAVSDPIFGSRVEAGSALMAQEYLTKQGLLTPTGANEQLTKDLAGRVRGAYRLLLTHLYSPMAATELYGVNARGMRHLLGDALSRTQQELNALGNRLQAQRSLGRQPTQEPQVAAGFRFLAQRVSMLQHYLRKADEPATQREMMALTRDMVESRRSSLPPDSGARTRFGLQSDMLSMFDETIIPGVLSAARSRYGELLTALDDIYTQKDIPDGLERAFNAAWEGALMDYRVERYGMPAELAKQFALDDKPVSSALGFEQLLAVTHPDIVSEIVNIKLAGAASKMTPGALRDLEDPTKRRNILLQMTEEMFAGSVAPLQELRALTMHDRPTGLADAVISTASKVAQEAGEWLGSNWAAARRGFGHVIGNLGDTEAVEGATTRSVALPYLHGALTREAVDVVDAAVADADRYMDPSKDARLEDALRYVKETGSMHWSQRLALAEGGDFATSALGVLLAPQLFDEQLKTLQGAGLLTPETLRSMYRDAVGRSANFDADDAARVEAIENEMTSNLRRVVGAGSASEAARHFGPMLGSWFRTAWAYLSRDVRATSDLVTNDPGLLVPFLVGGKAISEVGRVALSPAQRALSNYVVMRRAAGAMKSLAYFEPQTAAKLRDYFVNLPKAGTPSALAARVEQLSVVLEGMVRDHTLPAMPNPNVESRMVRSLGRGARRAEQIAKKLDRGMLNGALRDAGLDARVLDVIFDPSTRGAVSAAGRDVLSHIGLDSRRVYDFVAARTQDVARRISDAVEAGVRVPDLDSLPLTHDGLSSGGTRALVGRLFGRSPEATRHLGLSYHVRKWYMESRDLTQDWRELVAERRVNAEALMGMAAQKLRGREAALRAARRVGEVRPLMIREMQEMRRASAAVNEDLRALRNRPWDSEIRVSNRPEYIGLLDLEEMHAHAVATYGDADVFRAVARPQETFGDYSIRMARLQNRVNVTGPDRAALEAEAVRMKRELLRAYYDSPGLPGMVDIANIAPGARGVLGPAMARRETVRLRQVAAIRAKMAAPETTGEQMKVLRKKLTILQQKARSEGFDTGDIATPYNRLKRFMLDNGLVPDASMTALAVRNGALLRGGSLPELIAGARTAQVNRKINQVAEATRIERFVRLYDKLTPAQKQLYNTAVEDSIELERVRNRLGLTRGNTPQTLDANVNLLLREEPDFRDRLLKHLHQYGRLGRELYDQLRGRYAPHLYMAHERARLFPRTRAEKLGEGATDAPSDPFEAQADIDRFKAQVVFRNGTSVSELFDTADDAQRWLKERHGFEKVKETDGEFEGVTRMGDSAKVHRPITRERAADLQLLSTAEGQALRLVDLLQDAGEWTVTRILDHPQWSMTDAEAVAFRAAGREQEKAFTKNFVKVPDNPRYGTLAGKNVHYRILGALEDFKLARNRTISVISSVRDMFEHYSGLERLGVLGTALGTVNSWAKQALVMTRIAMSPVTVAFNYLSDSQIYARAAVQDKGFYAMRGIKARAWAVGRLLLDWVSGKKQPLDDPMYREFVDMGLLDEQMWGGGIAADIKKPMVELLFGKDLTIRREVQTAAQEVDANFPMRLLHAGLAAGKATAMRSVETMKYLVAAMKGQSPSTVDEFLHALGAKVPENPRVRRLLARYERARASLEKPALLDKDRARIQALKTSLEDELERLTPTFTNRMADGFTSVFNVMLGRPSGSFAENPSFLKELYGRIGQVNRLAAYRYMREELGLTPETARARIQTFMQNYARVPEAVQKWSNHTLGAPVLSFTYEQARIAKNMMTHNWPMMLGVYGTVPLANFYALAASGVDPYRVALSLEQDSGDNPSMLRLLSDPLFGYDGKFSTIGMGSLSPYSAFSAPMGFSAKLFRGQEANASLYGTLGTAGNFLSKAFLNQPLTNAAGAVIFNRDPRTGQPRNDSSDLWFDSVRQVAELFVPKGTPWLGSTNRALREAIDAPAYVRADRRVSAAQKLLQVVAGVRIRGSLLGDVGLDQAADFATRMYARAVGIRGPLPKDLAKAEAIGFDDALAGLYDLSRRYDPRPDDLTEAYYDRALLDLRRAEGMTSSGDPALVEKGEQLRAETVTRIRERYKVERGFYEAVPTDRDIVNKLRAVYRLHDFGAQFDSLPITRKLFIVVGAHAILNPNKPAEVEQVRDLVRRTWLAEESAEMRTAADPERVGYALNLLERHLNNPTTTVLERDLVRLRSRLLYIQRVALYTEKRERARDELTRRAQDELRAVRATTGKTPGETEED
ncbi:MAG: hypothetical protein L0099_07240 [Acidobacteria bacterium]|nr:hypothetical protein [Acidobacteriota bacterium]